MSKQLALSRHLARLFGYFWVSDFRLAVLVICVLTGIVVGLYVNSLGNDFVQWDDPGLILSNRQIRTLDWRNIKEIFTPRRASTYQPIRVLSYAIDYQFWRLNPFGFHLTNIVFYLSTCIMVFFAARELLTFLRAEGAPESNGRVAFFTTLLFAAHPVHVETVVWLSARKEVLVGFFFFSSLYCYLTGSNASERGKRLVLFGLAFLCFILATLSKPSAVVLPGIILLFEFSRGKKEWVRVLKRGIWFVPALLFSVIAIVILLKAMAESEGIYAYRGGDFWSNFLVAFHLFIFNIKLMALTVNYSAVYVVTLPYPVVGVRTLMFVLANIGLIALAISVFKKSKVVFFAVFWFYITLLPFSNIIPISTPLADRYVFIPSFAYCLLVALGMERLWSVRLKNLSEDFFPILTSLLLIGLLGGYSYMTVKQNKIWKNSYTLWADALAKNPRNTTAMNGVAVVYLDRGMNEKAFELLTEAIEINPDDFLVHNNLGIACRRLGQYEKGEHHFLSALSLKPGLYEAQVNLGSLLADKGDFEKAIGILTKLLAEYPQDSRLHSRMGYVYELAGKWEEAVKAYEKSIELTPHIMNPYESLGLLYLEKLNDPKRALYFFKKGIEMAPDSKRVREIAALVKFLESSSVDTTVVQ